MIPKRRNRRRSKQIVEPELRTIVETPFATMADTRTMSELLQAPTEGYGDVIVIPAILAEIFELKVRLLQLVTSSKFHGFERDDPHAHIHWFNKITSTLKYKNVPHDAIKLMLFPFSFEGAARIWLEKEPPRSILTWEDLVSKFVNYFFPPLKTTNLKNDITNFQQKFDEMFSDAWDRFKELLRKCLNHGFSELHQIDMFYNALTQPDKDSLNAAAGGNLLNRTPQDALTIIENKSKVCTSRNKPIVSKVSPTTSSSPSPDITALTDIVKELVLMNKANQQAFVKAVKKTCVTCGGPHLYYECLATDSNTFNAYAATWTYNQGGNGYRPQGDPNYRVKTKWDHPAFLQMCKTIKTSIAPNYQAQVGPSNELTSYMKINEATLRAMQTQMTNMKTELRNEFKSSLPSNTVTNPRGDLKAITTRSGVVYDGPTIPPTPSPLPKEVERETEATKDKLSLLELTSTRTTLELANQLVAASDGVAEDVFVKVGKFYFLANFVVVDYDVDHRVPLIPGRPFLRTARALIDVHVNVIDVACEDNAQEVLGFSDSSTGGNPTPLDPIIASTSPSFTPFEGGDFILEEIEACLSCDSIPPGIDDADFDPEGDIRLLEKLLNNDPSCLLPPKELNVEEIKTIKSSIDDPLELELKDLPSHHEYAFLEGTNKLPVIISKELKDEEKATLLKVLKSHKRAIAWKISDIKGIDPHFCTHKILMEDYFKLAVQHQRRVNPKIHEVIKKEVIKLLDVGLIYPISDSPWVSPVHCVPKKGGMTVIENEDNELIPTRLVTGWRICIDCRKLNDATHKDHLPLPFMDQMVERLAGNEYYCFLDGFLGYFQIHIDPQDQEKTTFTCPFGTFAYQLFNILKKKLTKAPILVAPDWDLPFEIMCDASDYAVHVMYGVMHQHSTRISPQKWIGLQHGLKRILERTVGENHASWSDKLDDALWAFRTAFKTPIGCTPYKLVYRKACHLPIELEHKAYWALKHCNFNLKSTGDHRKIQMNELNELWDQAYENSLIYKEKTKRINDSKIKNRVFNVGDRVLLFNSRLKIFSAKLKTRWTRTFTVTQVFPYGTAELSQTDGPNFKVNGHRLKHYFGGNIPPMVVADL
ncbi:reverse transcriptase domain-containing protein [Tanacetum coccineum]